MTAWTCARRVATLVAVLSCAGITATAAADPPEIAPPKLSGYVQARETCVTPTGLTATLNRARLSADGALPNRFTYRLLVELESGAAARAAGTVSLREAIIRWSLAQVALQFGQFKTPFSREYMIPVPALETADFSAVVDTLAPKYEIGAMAEYSVPLLTALAGVFNGEGANAGLNRDSTVLAVARVSARPLAQATLAGHVARYSADSTRYGADVSIEQSGLMARGEVLGQRKRGRARDDFGWYVLSGYRVLPWLQLLAKQEDFQRPGIGRARRISATTAGANLELPGGRTRILANFVPRASGYPRVKGNAVIAQIQVRF